MKKFQDLPKDILVSLLLNIERRHEKEKRELVKKVAHSKIHFCQVENCEEFEVRKYNNMKVFSTIKGNMIECDVCEARYCETHNQHVYFYCCAVTQCKGHSKCEICSVPICGNCTRDEGKCEKCSN
jgi:hypothetical protein